MRNMEAPPKNLILSKTNCGLDIYAHILRKCFPNDDVVMHLCGKDCGMCRNPFNDGKKTLHIWIEKSDMPGSLFEEYAQHEDTDGAIIPGDAFCFAERYYRKTGEELRYILNEDMKLNIGIDGLCDVGERGSEVIGMIVLPTFSFYRAPVSNVKPYKSITLLDVYAYVRGCYAKLRTEKLRSIADAKQRRLYKAANFDYCTFSGVFVSRSDRNIIRHSGLMCLDFDHIANLEDVFNSLLADEYFETQMLFRSPSGDGLKWVVAIDDIDKTPHGEYFNAISCYIGKTYGIGIDSAGKDVSRACFLPYDPDAFINPKYL